MKHALLIISLLLCATHVFAQTGTCDQAVAEAYLDVNNVRARILNNGGLFFRQSPSVYEVPKYSNTNAVFAAGIWFGGKVNGELRTAASTYGPWEFWAGPLDENGNPPADCKPYDKIYSVYQREILEYEKNGIATEDLLNWPWELGAPVVDGDGNPDNYNLAGGDRPELRSHQTLWWVMNDRGNVHERTDTAPIGIEVQVTAFAAVSSEDFINDATLYEYKFIYKGNSPLEEAYFSFWQDVDLGNFDDDYVGSDSTLGFGYTYNSDNFDEGGEGYGEAPPAVGFDIVQGPITDSDGLDNNGNGAIDEDEERASMTSFTFYNGGAGVTGDPSFASDFYNLMQGRWKDGQPFTFGGDARGFSDTPASFMFSGNPATGTGWTEFNPAADGSLPPRQAGDRRSTSSTGPFTMQPGDEQEITVAVIWARGDDHLDSINELKAASRTVQEAYETGFAFTLPQTPPLQPVTLTAPANQVQSQPVDPILQWAADENAETYHLQWSADSSFADVQTQTKLRSTSFQIPNLPPESHSFWRVRAINASELGPWSEARSFSTARTRVGMKQINFAGFMTVANAAGPIDPPDMAAFAVQQSGFPVLEGNLTPENTYPDPQRPTSRTQQSTNDSVWGIHTPQRLEHDSFPNFVRIATGRNALDALGTDAYEWRFTQECYDGLTTIAVGRSCLAQSSETYDTPVRVPFELWNVGDVNDPADDFRLIPWVCDNCESHAGLNQFGLAGDHLALEGPNDPYTMPVSWYNPVDNGETPGEGGYQAYFENHATSHDLGDSVFHNLVLIQENGGDAAPYRIELPEPGTIFRIVMAPVQPPVPASPVNRSFASTQSVALYWNATPATSYHIQVDTSPEFLTSLIDTSVDALSFLTTDLPEDQTYYWRVRLLDGAGEMLSDWSDTWRFTIPAGVETNEGIPDQITLQQSYPNPVSTTAFIRYALPKATPVKLELYDTLGRQVRVLIDATQSAGWHEAVFDASNLPNGLYFYRMTAGDFKGSKTMMLIR